MADAPIQENRGTISTFVLGVIINKIRETQWLIQ